MKRTVFTAILMAFVAFVNAQVYSIIASPPTDSVRATYLTIRTGAGNTATYTGHFIYGKISDTLRATPAIGYSGNGTATYKKLDSLQQNSDYRIAWVATANGVSDTTTPFVTVHTPQILPMAFTYITMTPGVNFTRVGFHYNLTGGYHAQVGFEQDGGVPATGLLNLVGVADTFFDVTGTHNVAGRTYTANDLFGTVVGYVQGIPQYHTEGVPDYTVPSVTGASVGTISVTRFQDSLIFTTRITSGNSGPDTITEVLTDSVGGFNYPPIVTVAYGGDTTLSYHHTHLRTASGYSVTITARSSGGTNAKTAGTQTLQINPSTIDNWDTLNPTTSSVVISVTASSHGTWNGSRSRVSIKNLDKNGVSHTQTGTWFTGTQMPTFTLTNLNPGPAQNSAWIYVEDSLGLKDSLQITFTLLPLPALRVPNAPTWGTLVMASSSMLEAHNVHLNVNAGDTNKLRFVVEDLTAGGVDTTGSYGIFSSSGTNALAQLTGLIGGHTYLVTPFATSGDNQYAFGTGLQQYTNAPQSPIILDILVDTSNSRVKITVRANGQGTPSKLYLDVMQGTGIVHSYAAISIGTDYISYDYYPSQYLDPSTLYYASATIKDMNGDNPMQDGRDFVTPAAISTGTQDVAADAIKVYPNPTADFIHVGLSDSKQSTVTIVDLTGRSIMSETHTGTFALDLRNESSGIYLVQIADENNKTISVQKIVRN
ncbi:MAG: hypothetical protein JWM20_412 [Patescibacteria group bacterium]|nr:hypothetical protein [Patescibacteria group bacterium]